MGRGLGILQFRALYPPICAWILGFQQEAHLPLRGEVPLGPWSGSCTYSCSRPPRPGGVRKGPVLRASGDYMPHKALYLRPFHREARREGGA